MNTEEYKNAQEAFAEWQELVDRHKNPANFKDWIKEKVRPKDPLFEKWKKFVKWVSDDKDNNEFGSEADFDKLKEIFKEELSYTLTFKNENSIELEEINKIIQDIIIFWDTIGQEDKDDLIRRVRDHHEKYKIEKLDTSEIPSVEKQNELNQKLNN